MQESVSTPAESGDHDRDTRPVAPGVTAAVVAYRPGEWFEETLVSLRAQDYARLNVVVIAVDDEGGSVATRVHAVLPDAEVRSVSAAGFGEAANDLLTADLTRLLLLCHDDVHLAPDAVRRLVEEAIRSNAGVVGPKFVDWDQPELVREVGFTADKTGALIPLVEPDELDQEQYDAVRDVFSVSAACMLLRSDLFEAVGGFDEAITFRGEDLDLCWRAHVAGARVMVAPAAVVRHRARLEERRPADDALRLRKRHQLRATMANYGFIHLLRVLPQAALLAVTEAVFGLVTGHGRRFRAVTSAWTWNVGRMPSLLARRRSLRKVRTVKDADIRRLQGSGFAPITTYLRSRRDGDSVSGRTIQMFDAVRSGTGRSAGLAWGLVLLIYFFGVRHLATRGIPLYGEMTSFGDGAVDALSEWWSGWRDEGLGREAPAPISQLFIGLAGLLTFGKMALLRTIVVLGAPLLGALGIWSLVRPFGSVRARIVGLVAYLANPLAYNAIANGSLSALLLFAAAPWLFISLGRAAQQSPFGLFDGGRGPGVPVPSVPREILTLGLLIGVTAAFVPSVLLLVPVMALAVFVGSMLSGHVLGSGRLIVVGVVGLALALALQLPAALDGLDAEWALLGGTRSDGVDPLSLADAARLRTGPIGSGLLGWALVAAAVLPLILATGPRFAWALRSWVLYLGSVAIALVGAQGLLPVGLPRPEVLLVPAAVGLSMATALGMAAFETDLRRFRFGWRQMVPFTAFLALALAPLPILVSSFDGQWTAPSRDFAETLSNIAAADTPGQSRTLWIGDPDVVPTSGWEYEDGLIYALSNGPETTVLDRWTGSSTPETRQIAEALDLGFSKGTNRLGSLLGPMGVRYIAVPERIAPAPDGDLERPVPSGLLAMLGEQLDLERIENIGLVVYRNSSWVPVRSSLPVGAATSATASFRDGAVALLSDATPVLGTDRTSGSAVVSPQREVYVAAAGEGWELTVGGRRALETEAFGWAQAFSFDGDSPGAAKLTYHTPSALRLALLAQLAGWLLVVAMVARLVSIDREGA